MDKTFLRTQMDYSRWASERLLDAAAGLTGDELHRDFGTADKSIQGTLAHLYWAELLWVERMEGVPMSMASPPDVTPGWLQENWPAVWQRWADCLGERSADSIVKYRRFNGDEYEFPVWQIVLHVVNHGTHHRGQIAGFLRALGKTPQMTDLIVYYRLRA